MAGVMLPKVNQIMALAPLVKCTWCKAIIMYTVCKEAKDEMWQTSMRICYGQYSGPTFPAVPQIPLNGSSKGPLRKTFLVKRTESLAWVET